MTIKKYIKGFYNSIEFKDDFDWRIHQFSAADIEEIMESYIEDCDKYGYNNNQWIKIDKDTVLPDYTAKYWFWHKGIDPVLCTFDEGSFSLIKKYRSFSHYMPVNPPKPPTK